MNALVFEGGGIKGLCYIGALEKLEELHKVSLESVKYVGGTSAGSIVAALIASNHSVTDMKDILYKMDWNKLKDGNGFFNFFRLFKKLGYHKGESLETFMEKLLFDKVRRRHLTFQQLYLITGKHLRVVGTNLTQGKSFYMDHIHTPNMTVAKGVHISCCLPLFFQPVMHEGDYCIDGGVLNNLDLQMFVSMPDARVLAFDLQENRKETKEHHCSKNLAEFVMKIVKSIHKELNKVPKDNQVTVLPINETQIEFTNFDINDLQKRYMISVGREAVENNKQLI